MLERLGTCLLVAVLGLTLVACGDDKKEDDGTNADVDATVDVDIDDAAKAFTGKCAELVQAYAGAYANIGSIMAGTASEELEKAAEYFKEVADALPEEIRADFAIFAEAYNEFAKAVVEADIDFEDPSSIDPEAFAKLSTLTEKLESAEVQAASERVSAYLEEKCGDGTP